MLSALSGCLGENEEPSLWLWNLVPTPAHMPSNDIPKNCQASYDMLGLPFFIIRENLAEHWSGNEVQTCNLRGRYKVRISNAGLCRLF